MLVILTVVMLIGVMTTTVRTVSAWLAGQVLIVLLYYIMPRTLPVFILAAGTLSDLAFASVSPNSCLLDRYVLEKFPRSQHQPSLITPLRFAMAVSSMPVKPWNFRKGKWSHYIALKYKFAKTLLSPDSLDVDAAYQDFCNTKLRKQPKRLSHAGIEITIFRVGMQSMSPSIKPFCSLLSLAATALLSKLDRKWTD